MWWPESTIQVPYIVVVTFFCTLLLQLSSFLLASSITSWWTDLRWNSSGERWTWHRLDSHRLCFSHTLCDCWWWGRTPQSKWLPSWTWKGVRWHHEHQEYHVPPMGWGLHFKADARLTRPHFSLCFKDLASQIATEFLSKSRRVQLDLAVLEHKQVCIRKAKNKKQKQNTV